MRRLSSHGGRLTHRAPVNVSGKLFRALGYKLPSGHGGNRLRLHPAPRRRTQIENDRRRRVGLLACHRLETFPRLIAAKAVAFKEALDPRFSEYQKQVVENSRTMARVLTERGLRIVSGGRDCHMTLRSHSVAHRSRSIRMQFRMIRKSRR